MSTDSPAAKSAINGIRTALGIGGVVAVVVGVLILVWPEKTAAVVAIIIALYLIAAGLVYAGLGIFSKTKGGWARVGHILLGLLFIIGGVLALFSPVIFAAWIGVFLAILVGILWIVEGIVSLSTLGDAPSKGWTVFFAIVSILAGIFVLFSPLWAITLLWLFLGISLIILGIVQVVRAFTFSGKDL